MCIYDTISTTFKNKQTRKYIFLGTHTHVVRQKQNKTKQSSKEYFPEWNQSVERKVAHRSFNSSDNVLLLSIYGGFRSL